MPMPDDVDPIQDAKHARETAAVSDMAPTPAQALAAFEAANARKKAAQVEQRAADAAWVKAAELLAQSIDLAGHNPSGPVLIAGKVVEAEWDGDYWAVKVQTPPVLG